jgi:hypothetical protein
MNVTAPLAAPLVGVTFSQLHAAVLGTETWKLAPLPELVSVTPWEVGTGPPTAWVKFSVPLPEIVTVTLGLTVKVTGIVTGPEGSVGEVMVMLPL